MFKFAVFALVAVLGLSAFTYSNHQFEPDYEKMLNATVYITAKDPKTNEELGHGSGVILENGLVVSAAHVFDSDTAKYIIKTRDGFEYSLKILVKNDDEDTIVVKPSEDLSDSGVKISCEPVKVGQELISIGNPTFLTWITTFGRVSAPPTFIDGPIQRKITIMDNDVAPGMSGGPAFNIEGEVVGLNDAILTAPSRYNAPPEVNATLPPPISFTGISILVPSETVCAEIDKVK